MGLFDWLRQKISGGKVSDNNKASSLEEIKHKKEDDWESLPAYVDVDTKEYQLVSVIAGSIAAGTNPDSKFTIKKIQKINPEVKKVSIISTALAAKEYPESQFVIKKIRKKKI